MILWRVTGSNGRRGAEVGNVCHDPNHSVAPDLLASRFRRVAKVHIHPPIVRIPRHLPIEVQTAEQLHAHIKPEAGIADPGGLGIPSTFFDQSPRPRYMIHSLQCSLGHDFVHVQDDGSGGDNDGVSVGVLHLFEQQIARGLVVLPGCGILICRIDQIQMSSSTC